MEMDTIQKEQVESLIAAYLSKKAIEEDLHQLKTWIDIDPEHYRYFQTSVNIRQGINPVFDPDTINVEAAEKKVRKKIDKNSPIQTILLYWQRIAAIIAIPLLLFSFYLAKKNTMNETMTSEYHEVSAPSGMLSQLTLPDGSKVWLNGGSSLKYPMHFDKGKRNIELNGEGYFEVEADKKNPFVLQTRQMTLTATGTAFNVDAYAIDSTTTVTMINGKIDVAFVNSPPITMQPGERASYNNRTLKKTIERNNPAPETKKKQENSNAGESAPDNDIYKWYAWKDGLMIFRDDPLAYVFKRLELTFNVSIIIKDAEIADALYRATFEKESLGEILHLLELTAPIQFEYAKRTRTANNHFDKLKIYVHKRVN
jgi:ferric-dicitrate binding protein FerR (iron transport regulator)